ncbi:MAG: peptidylprolyl isomerase [Lachnospiraceae bacterium]|nr:peptidylprolyl isomerase [Lachnospiraceae bacterium]
MKRRKLLTVILAAALTASVAAGCGKKEETVPEETAETVTEETAEPEEQTKEESAAEAGAETEAETKEETADPAEVPYAEITVKDYGLIRVMLEPAEAPETVRNFIDLAESGFYDGLTFHRIMDGFMMQGGDPDGNGTGGADKTIKGEFALNGVENNISHVRGVISMARSQDPDSASSQFFIVQSDSTFLDGQYAGFGRVTEGIEIVDQICADAKPTDNNGTIPPAEQPVMESVKIVYEKVLY